MNATKTIAIFAFFLLYMSTAKVFADEYTVSIDKDTPRLVRVSALVKPDGNEIGMNEEGIHGLKNGWATFVENIKVSGADGRTYKTSALNNSRWKLLGYKSGTVRLEYNVRLKHDQVKIEFGDNGAAYATPDGVMWSGRALFIAGKPSSDVMVHFNVPQNWKVTTPWEKLSGPRNSFRIQKTEYLVNSAIFAGTHTEFDLAAGEVTLRVALSGKNTLKMREQISRRTQLYLNYYGDVLRSATRSQMVLIASDRSYWGGEVMGRAISISIGGEPPEGFDPLDALSHVIAHEIFHVFSWARIEFDQADEKAGRFEWFNEGFGAEYAAWTARLRSGEITAEEFLAEMVDQDTKYKAKVTGKLALISAGIDKAANYDTVYSGGLIAAVSLDFLIRTETGNKQSLEDLWTYLLKEHPRGGEPLTIGKLFGVVKKLFGESIAKEFEGFINTPNEIHFYQNAGLMGLKLEEGKLIPDPEASEKQTSDWKRYRELPKLPQ
ncbi:MAG: hypothetical protein KDB79_01235 [Acidobacteria bacterium]|nr:hypothetical protein [Acidobacteriota bacterium]